MAVAASSGAFSGLLAAAIGTMSDTYGYSAWRWIFWIEGGVTVALGIWTPFLLVDTPELSHRWLDQHQIRYLRVMNFIKNGGTKVSGDSIWAKVFELTLLVRQWRLWAFALLFHNIGACGYGK